MNLAVGLRSDQQPERRNDHVRVYEERFAPPTSALALSAIAVGIAEKLTVRRQGKHSRVRAKDETS
jgi:hypothetical protein